jgi:hypothetical protein
MVFPGNLSSPDTEPRATEFELTDQNGRTHTFRFPRQKVSILLFGDREGSEQLEGWIRPLAERYDESIDIKGVAELSGVPALARGMVRRIMRREIKYSVMLDWKGDISKTYGNQKGAATLVVVSRDGRIVYRTSGAAQESELERLYKVIDQVM